MTPRSIFAFTILMLSGYGGFGAVGTTRPGSGGGVVNTNLELQSLKVYGRITNGGPMYFGPNYSVNETGGILSVVDGPRGVAVLSYESSDGFTTIGSGLAGLAEVYFPQRTWFDGVTRIVGGVSIEGPQTNSGPVRTVITTASSTSLNLDWNGTRRYRYMPAAPFTLSFINTPSQGNVGAEIYVEILAVGGTNWSGTFPTGVDWGLDGAPFISNGATNRYWFSWNGTNISGLNGQEPPRVETWYPVMANGTNSEVVFANPAPNLVGIGVAYTDSGTASIYGPTETNGVMRQFTSNGSANQDLGVFSTTYPIYQGTVKSVFLGAWRTQAPMNSNRTWICITTQASISALMAEDVPTGTIGFRANTTVGDTTWKAYVGGVSNSTSFTVSSNTVNTFWLKFPTTNQCIWYINATPVYTNSTMPFTTAPYRLAFLRRQLEAITNVVQVGGIEVRSKSYNP